MAHRFTIGVEEEFQTVDPSSSKLRSHFSELIGFGKRTEVFIRDLAIELLEFVDDGIKDLGSRSAVSSIGRILEEGTSAERQLRVYRETNDLKAVVRHLVEETPAGVGRQVATAAGAN